MGLLTDFIIYGGFRPADKLLYSPGALFSVSSKLAEEVKPDAKRRKVQTLLNRWNVDPQSEAAVDRDGNVSVYALEMHAVNDKDFPLNGYNTYIFIPEDKLGPGASAIKTTYSNPQDVADDEDPLKVLSATYSDENGVSTNPNICVYELGCEREEFYPLDIWDKNDEGDPVEEIFAIFDTLKSGEFAGVQVVLRPKRKEYDRMARRRIKSIEDPDYEEQISLFDTIRRYVNGEKSLDEEAASSVRGQKLDKRKMDEVAAIRHKVDECMCFHGTIRVYASSQRIADYISSVIIQNMGGTYNGIRIANRFGRLRDAALRVEGSSEFLMDHEEIASLWHVPDATSEGKKLIKPLPAAMTPPEEVLDMTFPRGTDGDIRYLLEMCANG